VLTLRHWGDESVVFDSNAGKTHLLAFPAGLILSNLADGEKELDGLASLIAETTDLGWQDALKYVEETVASLEVVGLVVRLEHH